MNECGRPAEIGPGSTQSASAKDQGSPVQTSRSLRSGGDELPPGFLDRLSVLLVEDDPASREALEVILAYGGARVVSATSMHDGLACYERTLPAIVVSDISLPDEDGCALMRAIRARELGGTPTPAIAVSGLSDGEASERARRAGFDAFLAKPIDFGELFRLMRTLIWHA